MTRYAKIAYGADMSTTMSDAERQRGAGRPTVIDRDAVAAAALEVWSHQGVSATTWADLALATGVSVRTLMRHFPAQSDIAWVGVPAAVDRLQNALDAAPADLEPMDALRRGIIASVIDPASDAHATETWLAVVAEEPLLRAASTHAWRPWTAVIAGHLERCAPAAAPALCAALAAAVQAATVTALLEASADRFATLEAALRAIDLHLPTTH